MHCISTVIMLFASIVLVACGGGGGGSSENHTPMGTLLVTVDSAADGSAIEGADVAVYDDKYLIVTSGTTDIAGESEHSLSPGSYTVKVSAQDFNPRGFYQHR